MAGSGVRGEVDIAEDRCRGAGVIERCHGDKGRGVGEVGHDTHLELVLGLCLLEVETHLEGVDITVELGHSIDATLVEDE